MTMDKAIAKQVRVNQICYEDLCRVINSSASMPTIVARAQDLVRANDRLQFLITMSELER